jgi:hypothetical protein
MSDVQAAYILPIRCEDARGLEELAQYLRSLRGVELIVVDGSPRAVFDAFDSLLQGVAHVAPADDIRGANGKVRGVLTGLRLTRHEKVVVADDDVRYDSASLRRIIALLDHADVIRPQNVFRPLPWHAALDSSRMLINRALDGDWPGTLAFNRSLLPHGYNADVLFENLELIRTVRANGGKELVARDLYVMRRPPTTRQYWNQRVRQAYDEFARPARLAIALCILPSIIVALWMHAFAYVAALAATSIALALYGWLRDRGYRHFSFLSVVLAPVWVLERGACAWLAVFERLCYGGARYRGGVIRAAASPQKELQRWPV